VYCIVLYSVYCTLCSMYSQYYYCTVLDVLSVLGIVLYFVMYFVVDQRGDGRTHLNDKFGY